MSVLEYTILERIRKNMKKIELYEPAMCCETGICGVEVDPMLLKMNSLIKTLQANGYDVDRYNLGQTPGKFVENVLVNELMQEKGIEVFPLLIIDGIIIKQGSYPNDDEILNLFGVKINVEKSDENVCC